VSHCHVTSLQKLREVVPTHGFLGHSDAAQNDFHLLEDPPGASTVVIALGQAEEDLQGEEEGEQDSHVKDVFIG